MKNLILVGGGSFGREIAEWLPNCIGFKTEWKFAGYLDNDPKRFGIEDKVLGSVEDYEIQADDVFLCALTEYKHKEKYVELLTEKGGEFATIISKFAQVSASAQIGSNVFVAPFCTVSCNVRLGSHSTLNTYAAIGHDAVVGKYCHINSFVLVSGFCHICDCVTIHPHSSILPRKRVGERSIVGVGSAVMSSVKRDVTVWGSPAKILRS